MSNTSTTPAHAGPAPLDGEALAELGQRTRAIARVLTDRVLIEQDDPSGAPRARDSHARAAAAQAAIITVPVGPGRDAPDVSLRITELASLAELAVATADAQGNATLTGSRAATVVNVVPDTMTHNARHEYVGGTQVTGAWIRPGEALSPPAGFSRMSVTLTHTSNRYLAEAVPIAGELHVHEMSPDGRIIAAGFRRLLDNGKLGTEVPVSDVRFIYRP